jgi:hypothetical protein
MVESSNHTIITAISDSNFEGFVSSNLHSQGWDIVARAVDIAALQAFITQNPEAAKNSILIYAPDLPGFSDDTVTELRTQVRHLIGYGTDSELATFASARRSRRTGFSNSVCTTPGVSRTTYFNSQRNKSSWRKSHSNRLCRHCHGCYNFSYQPGHGI